MQPYLFVLGVNIATNRLSGQQCWQEGVVSDGVPLKRARAQVKSDELLKPSNVPQSDRSQGRRHGVEGRVGWQEERATSSQGCNTVKKCRSMQKLSKK